MHATVFTKEILTDSLAVEPAPGKRSLDPFSVLAKEAGVKAVLHEVVGDGSRVEVHRTNNDFFYCVEGEIEFQTGGVLVDPYFRESENGEVNEEEIRAPDLDGAETHVLNAGDMLFIPSGLPHRNCAKDFVRFLVLKIPTAEVFPLEKINGWKNIDKS